MYSQVNKSFEAQATLHTENKTVHSTNIGNKTKDCLLLYLDDEELFLPYDDFRPWIKSSMFLSMNSWQMKHSLTVASAAIKEQWFSKVSLWDSNYQT